MTAQERWALAWPITWICLWSFRLAMKVKHMKRGPVRSALFVPAAMIMIPVDVVYNALIGSWVFWEVPREWLFTHRVQRHYDNRQSLGTDRFLVTFDVAMILNKYDPHHIKMKGR